MVRELAVDRFDDALVARVCAEAEPHALQLNYAGRPTRALARAYAAFQDAVARRIPVEERRPSVVLRLRGPGAGRRHVLLIGGMGPPSDASMLAKVVLASGARLDVTLLSVPPPRTSVPAFVRHLRRLRALCRGAPAGACCYLLSNTAHVAFTVFALCARPTPVVDLADAAAAEVRRLSAASGAVTHLLTTIVAWRAGLYQSRLPGARAATRAGAVELQRAVDLAKAGERDEGRAALFGYLDALLASRPAATLVCFLCTDFALLSRDLAGEVEGRYPGVRALDADALFSRLIAAGSPAAAADRAPAGLAALAREIESYTASVDVLGRLRDAGVRSAAQLITAPGVTQAHAWSSAAAVVAIVAAAVAGSVHEVSAAPV